MTGNNESVEPRRTKTITPAHNAAKLKEELRIQDSLDSLAINNDTSHRMATAYTTREIVILLYIAKESTIKPGRFLTYKTGALIAPPVRFDRMGRLFGKTLTVFAARGNPNCGSCRSSRSP